MALKHLKVIFNFQLHIPKLKIKDYGFDVTNRNGTVYSAVKLTLVNQFDFISFVI